MAGDGIHEHLLGPQAVTYLRECLDICRQFHTSTSVEHPNGTTTWEFAPGTVDRTLPAALLALDLDAGRMWSYLPDGATDDEANDYHNDPRGPNPAPLWSFVAGQWYRDGVLDPDGGGVTLFEAQGQSTEARMITLVRDFLASGMDACCIADELRDVADGVPFRGWLEMPRPFIVVHPAVADLHSCLYAADADDGTLRKLLGSGVFWQCIALTRMPEGMARIESPAVVSEAALVALAARTEMIITTAYDDTGWLVWGRSLHEHGL